MIMLRTCAKLKSAIDSDVSALRVMCLIPVCPMLCRLHFPLKCLAPWLFYRCSVHEVMIKLTWLIRLMLIHTDVESTANDTQTQ